MNQIQTIESGAGILKEAYPDDPKDALAVALKRRREKLKETVMGPPKED